MQGLNTRSMRCLSMFIISWNDYIVVEWESLSKISLTDNLFKINFTLNEINISADVVEHTKKTNLEILACLYPKKEIRS